MIRIINGFIILFLVLSVSEAKSPEEIIKESIANYPGKCPCPYSIMSNGKECGKRSAYSKPGGYEPLCYLSDITAVKNDSINTQQEIRIVDGDTIHIDKIKYRAKLNNYNFSQGCFSDLNKNNYPIDLLILLEPTNLIDQEISLSLFTLLYDSNDKLIDRYYFIHTKL